LTDRLLAEHQPFTIRCLHNTVPLADDRFAVVNKAKWHGLDLKPDLEAIWLSLHSSARRAIKKAQRDGVVVRIARHETELRSFFELHLGIRKHKYRMLAQPYDFFEKIWHHFIEPQRGLLMLATYQDQIIGGVLFLEWKAGLYYKFNVSAPGHLAHRPNDLIIWEGIKYAKAKGLSFLDFGLSDWDQEGLLRYKRKYAGEEKTISMLRYLPEEEPTEREKQLQDLLPRLTNLFTDEAVPDQVTEQAGEALYRFFT
jgi:lipid II:glycine glycyltransferase (peptidoglycan interpeptide bridge formation enzyme)